jgi:SAM-dependent methyltransferase
LAVSDFETPKLWRHDLDHRWPERLEMKAVVKRLLVEHNVSVSNPVMLELGIGDGELLTELLKLIPHAQLAAMDVSQTLLDYCKEIVVEEGSASDRAIFIKQDLSQSWSSGHEGTFSSVYSLQSIHDFGGRDALVSTYTNIASVLKPGGMLINADFVVPLPHDTQAEPRRFPVADHLQILRDCGFEQAKVIRQEGLLGCMMATKPALASAF